MRTISFLFTEGELSFKPTAHMDTVFTERGEACYYAPAGIKSERSMIELLKHQLIQTRNTK